MLNKLARMANLGQGILNFALILGTMIGIDYLRGLGLLS